MAFNFYAIAIRQIVSKMTMNDNWTQFSVEHSWMVRGEQIHFRCFLPFSFSISSKFWCAAVCTYHPLEWKSLILEFPRWELAVSFDFLCFCQCSLRFRQWNYLKNNIFIHKALTPNPSIPFMIGLTSSKTKHIIMISSKVFEWCRIVNRKIMARQNSSNQRDFFIYHACKLKSKC